MTDNSEIILHFLRRIDARLDLLERSAMDVEVSMTNLEAALGHMALLRADYQAAIAEKRAVKQARAPADDDLDALLASLRDPGDDRKQSDADAEDDLDALLASLEATPAGGDLETELDALLASLNAACDEEEARAELDHVMEQLLRADEQDKPVGEQG